MSAPSVGPLARIRRKPLRTLVATAAALLAVAIVLAFDPIGTGVSAGPWPDLPEVPDLPSWAKWVWRAFMVSLLVLAFVGTLDKTEDSDRDKPEEMGSGDRPPKAL
jgi:hypothetical protein